MSNLERKRNYIGAGLLALLVLLVGTLVWQSFQSSMERDEAQTSAATSQQQKKNLAEEVADACQSGQVVKSAAGVDLCARAATIAEQPATVEGPAGPRGLPGLDGVDGADGATGPTGAPGRTGPAGADGTDGTDGLGGEAGLPGAGGVPGPAGPAGKDGAMGASGATGSTGLTGDTGRGITDVQCVGDGDDSYWQITYTDGTTAQSSGPCRIEEPDPTSTPTPTP